jgi:hypothetical protein
MTPVYLSSFQISTASFESVPTFSQITTHLPVTSCGRSIFGLETEAADLTVEAERR